MWRETKVADILKSYAMKNSYDIFRDRKTAAALCSDLLYSFEECHIITMLFREGLGECLQGAPYSTAYDLSLAKGRVRTFSKKLGLDDEIVENTVNMVSIFADASISTGHISALEVLHNQRKQAQDIEKQGEQRTNIEQESDFDELLCSTVEVLSISSHYKGTKIPSLKAFTNLKEFSNFYPLLWSQVSEINMKNLEKLYFSNVDSDSAIHIVAPMLEELSISCHNNKYEALTPLEKMVGVSTPRLDIQADNLKKLNLSHMSGYDISAIAKLKNLETLIINSTEIADLSWLEGCSSLKSLHLYSKIHDIGDIPKIESLQELYLDHASIESVDGINLFPNLRVLSLRNNKICRIEHPDRLYHIRRIDLSRNPIVNNTDLADLNIPELILTDADRTILYGFAGEIEQVFRRAYRAYVYREKNFDNLHPFLKNSWLKKSDADRFTELVNDCFESSFYSYNPTSLFYEYDTKVKPQYLEFVREHYPFISIKEEYEKQIQMEIYGASHYYKEEPGNVIYLNQSLYIISIKLENGANGIDLNCINTGNQRLSNSIVEKLIAKNCPYIDLSRTKVMITIQDIYRTGKIDGIEVGILAASYTLKNKISLPTSTFVAGEYINKKGQFKRLKISPREIHLAVMGHADEVMYLTSGKCEKTLVEGIRIDYCNDLIALQSRNKVI